MSLVGHEGISPSVAECWLIWKHRAAIAKKTGAQRQRWRRWRWNCAIVWCEVHWQRWRAVGRTHVDLSRENRVCCGAGWYFIAGTEQHAGLGRTARPHRGAQQRRRQRQCRCRPCHVREQQAADLCDFATLCRSLLHTLFAIRTVWPLSRTPLSRTLSEVDILRVVVVVTHHGDSSASGRRG